MIARCIRRARLEFNKTSTFRERIEGLIRTERVPWQHLEGVFGQPFGVRGLVSEKIGWVDVVVHICREPYRLCEIKRRFECGLEVGHVWHRPVCSVLECPGVMGLG